MSRCEKCMSTLRQGTAYDTCKRCHVASCEARLVDLCKTLRRARSARRDAVLAQQIRVAVGLLELAEDRHE